jgi:perosamine synthetase
VRNGTAVSDFERALADYCGANFAICLANGTATIHTALVAMGVKPGDAVHTTPLTMSATTLAILQAGATPVYHDINPKDWLMEGWSAKDVNLPVSLYGLHVSNAPQWVDYVDDAAQTLRKHNPNAKFTSLSFQASKILALSEGGALLTNDEGLAERAREFSSLGYRMKAGQPRIDPAVIKSPDYERHHWPLAFNYRMSDHVASEGRVRMTPYQFSKLGVPYNPLNSLLDSRLYAASLYREAIEGCDWIQPQAVPEGWTHDYWCYAIALRDKSLWKPFTESIVRHGGEMPYGAWALTFNEPAFRHLKPAGGTPIASDLQPRLVQLQTNNLESAERNAKAVRKAIEEINFVSAFKEARDLIDAQPVPRHVFSPDATGIPCE